MHAFRRSLNYGCSPTCSGFILASSGYRSWLSQMLSSNIFEKPHWDLKGCRSSRILQLEEQFCRPKAKMSSADNSPLKPRARLESNRRCFHRGYLWPWLLVLLIPIVLRFVMFYDVTFPLPSSPSSTVAGRPEELPLYRFHEAAPDHVKIQSSQDRPVHWRITNDPYHGLRENKRSTWRRLPVTKRPEDQDTTNVNLRFPEENEEDNVEVKLRQIGKRIIAVSRWENWDMRKASRDQMAAEKKMASEEQMANEEREAAGLDAAEERRAAKVDRDQPVADEFESAEEWKDVEEREAEEGTNSAQGRMVGQRWKAETEKEAEEGWRVNEQRDATGEINGEAEKLAKDVREFYESRRDEGQIQVVHQAVDQKLDGRTGISEQPTEEHNDTEGRNQEKGNLEKHNGSDLIHRESSRTFSDQSFAAGERDLFDEADLGLPEDNEKMESIAVAIAENQETQAKKQDDLKAADKVSPSGDEMLSRTESEEKGVVANKQIEEPKWADERVEAQDRESRNAEEKWTSEEQTLRDDSQEAQREEIAAEKEAEGQKELAERRDVEATEEKREEEELKDAEGVEREIMDEQQNRGTEQEEMHEHGGSLIEEVTGQTQGRQSIGSTASGECDLFEGDWVWDPEGPLYTNSTCFYIQLAQNCMSNGRPDTDYLHWKWKPRDCDLPRFDARAFLEAFRGRTIGFVGDSLARNQMQSVLCMLSQIEIPKLIYQAHDDLTVRWLFEQHQVTLAVVWSPYLLKESDQGVMGFAKGQSVLYLDELDTAWTPVMKDFDIIIVSIGHWYFKPSVYVKHEEVVGCHYCPGLNLTEMKYQEAYQGAVRRVLEKVVSEFKGIAIMSTFSISHFEGGEWNNGGQCRREKPLEKEEAAKFPEVHNDMYDIVMREFNSVASDMSTLSKYVDVKLEFLDVTKVSLMRADGHPGPYRQRHPFEGKDSDQWVPNDCLHWCLPGPVDTWNQLLVKIVHRHL